MKKVLAIILCVLMLSGCGENASVGIIGGSDGPTAIFVGEETEVQGVRMIKVDGKWYYDSGKVSSMVPRCGTLDGSLVKSVNEFEMPKHDGESNFETSGYQNATSITKEVSLEGNWRIFKRMPDSETDFGKYKYVVRLKGRHPNAVRDSEYIVLTNDLAIDFDTVSKSMFSSLSTDWLDCYIMPVLPDEDWGIRMWCEDVTNEGLRLVCEQFGGKATGDLQTGEWYCIEVMDEANEWKVVEFLPQEYDVAWNSIAYRIKKNDRTEWVVDWEWLYGELPEGHYRIGKKVMDFRAPGDFDEKIYYADFLIE